MTISEREEMTIEYEQLFYDLLGTLTPDSRAPLAQLLAVQKVALLEVIERLTKLETPIEPS
jgi:hypothetical protein